MKYDIAGLRQARAAAADKLKGFGDVTASTTDETMAQIEATNAEITALDRKIAAAVQAQANANASANPADPDPIAPGLPGSTPASARDPRDSEPGVAFAQITRAIVHTRGRLDAAHSFAERTYGASHPVTLELGAAMNTNDADSGGFLVPERFSNELIDLLLPQTLIRRRVAAAGNVVPLVGGTDNIPTVESGINAYYLGESTDIVPSEPTFGNIKMTEREMAAMVPISNKLIRHANRNVDLMVRNLIVRGMALAEDQAFLRGSGVGPGPRGLRYWPGITSFPANATVNVTNIETDARTAELASMQADIPLMNPGWLMAPRTFAFLRDMRDANGNLYYPSMQGPSPTWRGAPVGQTNSIPINLGGTTNESEVYYVDFGYTIIADSYKVRIDASDVASYKVNGTMVSAFSQNQTVIRALAGHDFAVTRPKAVAVITAVKWF